MANRATATSAVSSKVAIRDQAFRPPQVCAAVGITYRQLDYWVRTDLLVPSVRLLGTETGRLYSFEDLVTLKVVKHLLNAGMSLKRIRSAVETLQNSRVVLSSDKSATLLVDSQGVYLVDDAESLGAILSRSQGMFGIGLRPVLDEVERDLEALAASAPAKAEPLRTSETSFVTRVIEKVREGLVDAERGYEAGGRTLAALGGPKDLADRLLSLVPEPSPWDARHGPFYSSAKVAALLGDVSRQAVADRRKRGTLLGLETSDGLVVYPTWQFADDGQVHRWVATLIRPFASHKVDGWDVAGWLTSTFKALGGSSPLQYVQAGGDLATVAELAKAAASRLAA